MTIHFLIVKLFLGGNRKEDKMVIDSFVDCIPCVLTMADKLADKYIETKEEKFEFMMNVLKMITTIEYDRTAPYLTARVMRLLKEKTGIEDLYEEEKKKFNFEVLSLLDDFTSYVDNADDSIKTALKLSMAGNIIDSGIIDDISIDLVKKVIEKAMEDKFDEKLYLKFVNDLKTKKRIVVFR